MIVLHDMDGHAPFPHYHVTIAPRIVKIRDPNTGVRSIKETEGTEYIVCYSCGQWIGRTVHRKTSCVASCDMVRSGYLLNQSA